MRADCRHGVDSALADLRHEKGAVGRIDERGAADCRERRTSGDVHRNDIVSRDASEGCELRLRIAGRGRAPSATPFEQRANRDERSNLASVDAKTSSIHGRPRCNLRAGCSTGATPFLRVGRPLSVFATGVNG
jgi:hypothetical protein